jgi:dihydrolipoamide dehydrogenase
MNKKYNIVSVGAGAGGLQCCVHAASRGAKCALIDRMGVGGECLHYGCIPTKAMAQSIDTYRLVKNAPDLGIDVGEPIKFNFSGVMARQKKVVNENVDRIYKGLLAMKVDFYNGTASLISPKKVKIELSNSQSGQEREIVIEAQNILVSTGSSPNRLPISGSNLPGVLTNREIFNLNHLPKSMVVVGCGYVGVELAAIFANMGTSVRMLEKEAFLMGVDRKIAQDLRHILENKEGIKVETGVDVLEIQQTETSHYNVIYERDGQGRSAQGEIVLMATGRTPDTADLFEGDMGIAMDGPAIAVNEYFETSVRGIYAVGDVLNGAMTAYTAGTEAEVVAENCLGRKRSVDFSALPRCIFTSPPYAWVGMNEEEANAIEGLDYGIAEYPFSSIVMAKIVNKEEGFTRLIYEKGSGKILGGHILGPQASELIAELTLAINQGLQVKELASLLQFHPSLGECLQRAARVGWLMEDMGK